MPTFDIIYFSSDDGRLGEEEQFDASDLSAALVRASISLKNFQDKAYVTCVRVEEVTESEIEEEVFE